MRACERCRTRKIRCDAVTTYTWPCSACIRLEFQCVPPTYDGDITGNPKAPETERREFGNRSGSEDGCYQHVSVQQQSTTSQNNTPSIHNPHEPYFVYGEPSSGHVVLYQDACHWPNHVFPPDQDLPPGLLDVYELGQGTMNHTAPYLNEDGLRGLWAYNRRPDASG
jgi:hypothetical protein